MLYPQIHCAAVLFEYKTTFILNCVLVEPVYYGHLETNHTFKCPDYQDVLIFQVSTKHTFGTITKCVH